MNDSQGHRGRPPCSARSASSSSLRAGARAGGPTAAPPTTSRDADRALRRAPRPRPREVRVTRGRPDAQRGGEPAARAAADPGLGARGGPRRRRVDRWHRRGGARAGPDSVVIGQERPGKGAALQAGFEAATGDIIVMLDADGSTDPAEIPAFVGCLLAGADFVKGSRFLQGGGTDDMTAAAPDSATGRCAGSCGSASAAATPTSATATTPSGGGCCPTSTATATASRSRR